MVSKPRVKVPKTANAGDIITIKSLISHRMESGLREDEHGNLIPRHIINTFSVAFNGEKIFSVDLEPGMSANPYFEFSARVTEAGTFSFAWTDDAGEVIELSRDIALN